MKPIPRILTRLAPLLALALVGAGFFQARLTREARRAVAAAEMRRDELRRQFQRAEARLAEMQRTAASAKPMAGAPAISSATIDEAKAKRGATTVQANALNIDPRNVTATDPKLRAMHLEAFGADLDGTWGPLLAQLKLSPDKIAKFKALAVKHEERRLDVTAVAAEQKLRPGDPAVQKMRSEDGTVRSREMRALLGDDDFKLYNQYNHDLVLQPIVADMAKRTYFSTTPLTLAESQRLMTILSNNSEKRANDFVRENTVKWDQAVAQAEASGAFAPATLEALRRYSEVTGLGNQIGQKWGEIISRRAGKSPVESVWLPGVSFIKGGY